MLYIEMKTSENILTFDDLPPPGLDGGGGRRLLDVMATGQCWSNTASTGQTEVYMYGMLCQYTIWYLYQNLKKNVSIKC